MHTYIQQCFGLAYCLAHHQLENLGNGLRFQPENQVGLLNDVFATVSHPPCSPALSSSGPALQYSAPHIVQRSHTPPSNCFKLWPRVAPPASYTEVSHVGTFVLVRFTFLTALGRHRPSVVAGNPQPLLTRCMGDVIAVAAHHWGGVVCVFRRAVGGQTHAQRRTP